MGQLCSKVSPEPSGKIPASISPPTLKDFSQQKSLGKGAFGKVRIVHHYKTGQIYALKYINKQQCIRMRAVDNIISERLLLEEISCLFVVNLRFAFQDDDNMYMVIDLMTGGDLRFQLDQRGRLPEKDVQFYIAELSVGISILHSRGIVHRDLKPDNVLLDKDGHAYLTDFNIALRCSPDKPMTAVAGSMAYMAPEVLLRSQNGYNANIDWWSLGVVMYECLFGIRPFKGKTRETLINAIMNEQYHIPSDAKNLFSKDCLDCIAAFLTKDVTKRLGGPETGGLDGIISHPFFRSINWTQIKERKAATPFVPDTSTSNCDASHELGGLTSDDVIIRKKTGKSTISRDKRESIKGSSTNEATDKEDTLMQAKITELFRDYDYRTTAEPHNTAAKSLGALADSDNRVDLNPTLRCSGSSGDGTAITISRATFISDNGGLVDSMAPLRFPMTCVPDEQEEV